MVARLSLMSVWFMLLIFFLAHVVLVGCAHVRVFVSCLWYHMLVSLSWRARSRVYGWVYHFGVWRMVNEPLRL